MRKPPSKAFLRLEIPVNPWSVSLGCRNTMAFKRCLCHSPLLIKGFYLEHLTKSTIEKVSYSRTSRPTQAPALTSALDSTSGSIPAPFLRSCRWQGVTFPTASKPEANTWGSA
ncbi:hypothetical protein K1719_028289 [Acacia pycnantha]|nr:hypothetical protein K1719_028289 [Acacia pycnantha]